MKRGLALMWLVGIGVFGGLGGCVESSDEDPCVRKAFACHNKCSRSGLGSACHACCTENGYACQADKSYGFYSCPDAE
jgi:hypothetical protein